MGVPLRGAVDTTELSEGDAAAAEQALQGLRFGAAAAAPRHPDSFRYEIVLGEGEQRRVAKLDESELPADLWAVVNAALSRGKLD